MVREKDIIRYRACNVGNSPVSAQDYYLNDIKTSVDKGLFAKLS